MNTLTKIGVPFAAALMSAAVSAGTIVTEWDFSTDANFTGATFETGGVGVSVFLPDELSWGLDPDDGGFFQEDGEISDGNRSALTIGISGTDATDPVGTTQGGGPATGDVETIVGAFPGFPGLTADQFGLGISFTHWNNPIPAANDTLLSGVILDTLTLTPTNPVGEPVDAPAITFNFNFAETPNGGPCPIGGTPCADIFGFDLPGGGLNQEFTYDTGDGEVTYFAQVLLLNADLTGAAPITPLGATVCSGLGLSNNCLGFSTIEEAATTISFGFAITTERVPVPLPSTLALFGLGLLGLGYRAKRKAA